MKAILCPRFRGPRSGSPSSCAAAANSEIASLNYEVPRGLAKRVFCPTGENYPQTRYPNASVDSVKRVGGENPSRISLLVIVCESSLNINRWWRLSTDKIGAGSSDDNLRRYSLPDRVTAEIPVLHIAVGDRRIVRVSDLILYEAIEFQVTEKTAPAHGPEARRAAQRRKAHPTGFQPAMCSDSEITNRGAGDGEAPVGPPS
jgi:hypothetical protein